MDIIRVLATMVSLGILFLVLELIRRNRLKEKYSLLWLFSSVVMLCFSLSRELLHTVSLSIGIKYPPSFIFLLAFLFLTVITIHITSVISELSERNKALLQEIVLLREALKERSGKEDEQESQDK